MKIPYIMRGNHSIGKINPIYTVHLSSSYRLYRMLKNSESNTNSRVKSGLY